MALVYIGAFPPSYGGVTVKNENLFNTLKERIDIEKVDLNLIKKKKIKEIIRFLLVVTNRKNRFIIGVSGSQTRRKFCNLLYFINRKGMQDSILIIMGGKAAHEIVSDEKYKSLIAAFKLVFVETRGMQEEMLNAGICNCSIYPNCRVKPKAFDVEKDSIQKKLNKNYPGVRKCVFFSKIEKEKGVDIIIQAANEIRDVTFAFYGKIDEQYIQEFTSEIAGLENIEYKGIFIGDMDEKYKELAQYDILLLPTRWDAEGIPGIVVEGRIAGLVPLLSDHNYNKELVNDNIDGILLKDKRSSDELKIEIERLCNDKDLLYIMRKNSIKRAEDYYIDNYIDEIINGLL
ncbi:glycosyltransferase [Butyrivibrio sp. WCE2006]|uniref:glycosyltransferase n=1 Tax=Butyrivibrio sp. WCE2006 TaxID=1410611 RepID=UPI0005D13AF8|nr:glycosyltransferase [Butyrivibrio sp. WCE2006]